MNDQSDPKPVTKVINIPSPAALWSMAVKIRDGEKCVVCQSKDEISVVLLEGFAGISGDDGKINLASGATVCAGCRLRAETDEDFRSKIHTFMDVQPSTRLNVEVDRELYSKFAAVCRLRGTSVSHAVRRILKDTLNEVEDGTN